MLVEHWTNRFFLFLLFVAAALTPVACTTTDSHTQTNSVKVEPSIIAVSTPGAEIKQGSRFAWMDSAISLYRDQRLDSNTIQYLIEKNIKASLTDKGFPFVDSEQDADYTIAYTAALESALDDAAILRRYGLVPGTMRVPEDNPNYEKGTLLIYAFDSRSGEVIWRSAVQAAVDFSLDEQERKQRIGPIITDMFHTLPTK